MRKFVLVLIVLLLSASAWAAVTVNCTSIGSGQVQINYAVTDSNNIRAFGIRVDVNNGATISSIDVNDKDYYIFPGSIDINDTTGEVDGYGSAVAEGGDANTYMILEMGSLYAAEDPCHTTEPDSSGTICTFEVSKECTVSLSRDTDRGGVVMEDGSDYASLNGCAVAYFGCFPQAHADWSIWDTVGRPDCWCYPSQCYGDLDNAVTGDSKQGYLKVSAPDLTIFMSGWDIKEPPHGPGLTGTQICGDLGHDLTGDSKQGYVRVSAPDLTTFMNWWDVKEAPIGPGVPADCLSVP
jgi:hypothetical protein